MNFADLLDEYGSPAYVYDLRAVREAHASLRAALPHPGELFYSLKANPHPAIVEELRRLGCQAEVSSVGELRTTLAAGFLPSHCLYTGPCKTAREIEFALGCGVEWFSVDSPQQLRRLSDEAKSARRTVSALLRINGDRPIRGAGLAMVGTPSQFGADASWVLEQPQAFGSDAWVGVRGFHLYMGTNLADEQTLLAVIQTAIDLTVELARALGFEPDVVDLGGGFAHPFARRGARPEYPNLRIGLEERLSAGWPGWREGRPAVAFESGRYLVGAAGVLLCTVQDVKRSKGRTFVMLDSGIHHLGGMAGLRRVPRISPDLVTIPHGAEQRSSSAVEHETDVVGPLCTPLDSWARGIRLPELAPGAVIAVPNVGAYGLTGSLVAFLSHDPPVEIVVDGGRVVEASRLVLSRRTDWKGANRA